MVLKHERYHVVTNFLGHVFSTLLFTKHIFAKIVQKNQNSILLNTQVIVNLGMVSGAVGRIDIELEIPVY